MAWTATPEEQALAAVCGWEEYGVDGLWVNWVRREIRKTKPTLSLDDLVERFPVMTGFLAVGLSLRAANKDYPWWAEARAPRVSIPDNYGTPGAGGTTPFEAVARLILMIRSDLP